MLDAGNEAVRFARTRPGDDEDGAEGRVDGEALLGQGSEAHPLLILRSKVTSVTVWPAVCLRCYGVFALARALARRSEYDAAGLVCAVGDRYPHRLAGRPAVCGRRGRRHDVVLVVARAGAQPGRP